VVWVYGVEFFVGSTPPGEEGGTPLPLTIPFTIGT
jgi:hypothetical protein